MHSHASPCCPVCEQDALGYSIPVQQFYIFKCASCGLEYTHPLPSDQTLADFYATYSDIRARPEIVIRNAQRNLARLQDFGLTEQSLILDFGTGSGEFIRVAGKRCYGLELGTPTQPRTFARVDQLPVRQFDFITLWGVLEHLNDPLGTIRALSALLIDQGKLVITTVDAEGVIPYYYKPVEHLTYWTKPAFAKLFAQAGLQLLHSEPYSMVQARDIYLDRLLSRTPTQYHASFIPVISGLPELVEVPTNEIFVVAEKI